MENEVKKFTWEPVPEFGPEYAELTKRESFATGFAESYVLRLQALQSEINHGKKLIEAINIKIAETELKDPTLIKLEALRKTEEQNLAKMEVALERNFKRASNQIAEILTSTGNYRGLFGTQDLFRSRLDFIWQKDENFKSRVSTDFPSLEEFVVALENQTVSLEVLLTFLNAEAERFISRAQAISAEFQSWKREFYARTLMPDARKYVRVPPEKILDRLNKVELVCTDIVSEHGNKGSSMASIISIDSDTFSTDLDDTRHTTFHEMAHTIYGQGYAVNSEEK